MLSKEYRLRRKKDFEILFKEGHFFNTQLLTVKIWRVQPDKYPKREYTVNDLKIGIIVGTKVSKSAVKRNRVKRQLREIFRIFLKEGKLKNGYMVACIAKPSILGKEYDDIKKDVAHALQQAKVMSE